MTEQFNRNAVDCAKSVFQHLIAEYNYDQKIKACTKQREVLERFLNYGFGVLPMVEPFIPGQPQENKVSIDSQLTAVSELEEELRNGDSNPQKDKVAVKRYLQAFLEELQKKSQDKERNRFIKETFQTLYSTEVQKDKIWIYCEFRTSFLNDSTIMPPFLEKYNVSRREVKHALLELELELLKEYLPE